MSPANSLEQLLSELVTFGTYADNLAEINRCFIYLAAQLEFAGLHVNLLQSNGLPSIVATTQDTKSPKIFLQSHIDVVPAHEDSFNMKIIDGKIHGRGVFDMKFAAACFIELARYLKSNIDNYDFGIMFTSDEEIGGYHGVRHVLNEGYSSDVCVLPDGGDNWEIESGCNGVLMFRVTAPGKSAHGSRPWEGINAIEKLMLALTDIKSIFGDQEPGKTSVTISQVEGGLAVNQVPDQASATLDIRPVTQDDFYEKESQVRRIADEYGLNLETLASHDVQQTDMENQYVSKFIEVARTVSQRDIGQCHSYGSSDGRYFAEYDIPTILMRPEGGGAHSEYEWISRDGLAQYYEVIKAYVTEVAKKA